MDHSWGSSGIRIAIEAQSLRIWGIPNEMPLTNSKIHRATVRVVPPRPTTELGSQTLKF